MKPWHESLDFRLLFARTEAQFESSIFNGLSTATLFRFFSTDCLGFDAYLRTAFFRTISQREYMWRNGSVLMTF